MSWRSWGCATEMAERAGCFDRLSSPGPSTGLREAQALVETSRTIGKVVVTGPWVAD